MTYQLDVTGAIREQTLVGDTVVLADESCRALIKSTLTGGVVRLAQPKKAGGLVMSTLRDCLVDAVKPQRDSDFFTARFINCTFLGVYSGISFGNEGSGHHPYDFGGAEECDFIAATLDGCRFHNVDISSLRFPRWPHVVVPDPHLRATDVSAIEWPGHLGKYMQICTDKPPSVRASVLHIPSLVRLVACTEEQAREALERFGGVVM